MNRRQRKKAFKKKYGMNTVQFERELGFTLETITKTLNEIDWEEYMQKLAEAMRVALQRAVETIETTVDFINTKEFQEEIKKANDIKTHGSYTNRIVEIEQEYANKTELKNE